MSCHVLELIFKLLRVMEGARGGWQREGDRRRAIGREEEADGGRGRREEGRKEDRKREKGRKGKGIEEGEG